MNKLILLSLVCTLGWAGDLGDVMSVVEEGEKAVCASACPEPTAFYSYNCCGGTIASGKCCLQLETLAIVVISVVSLIVVTCIGGCCVCMGLCCCSCCRQKAPAQVLRIVPPTAKATSSPYSSSVNGAGAPPYSQLRDDDSSLA